MNRFKRASFAVNTAFAAVASILLIAPDCAQAQNVINIDATLYGFSFPTDPAPVIGQIITPISLAPGGILNQLTLGAGTYTLTNAKGMAGANPDFTGWRFNSGPNWVWSVVVADDSTHKVVFYTEASDVQSSQSAIAAQAAVQNVSGSFTLPAAETLDFMIRDYYLPDNAGGVAIYLQPQSGAVPEPGNLGLLLGAGVSGGLLALRRRHK